MNTLSGFIEAAVLVPTAMSFFTLAAFEVFEGRENRKVLPAERENISLVEATGMATDSDEVNGHAPIALRKAA